MASLVEHDREETDEQRLLKTVAYITIVDDYCKQIIRESDIMRTLGYDISVHTDDKLTDIIMNNFYSIYQPKCTYPYYSHPHPGPCPPPPVFLKLNHTQGTKYYIEKKKNEKSFPDSFLDINCKPMSYTDYLQEIIKQHKDDKKSIADRNFSEWVCFISNTDLLILIIHHNYRT